MATRSGRRAVERKEQTVGSRRTSGERRGLFLASLLAVGLATIVLVFVAADTFGGLGDPDPGAPLEGKGDAASPTQDATSSTAPALSPAPSPTQAPAPGPDGTFLVSCGDMLAPLDKQHRLPAECEPTDLVLLPRSISYGGPQYLRREALDALLQLFEAASADGFELVVTSGFRSYAVQSQTYQTWVQLYGKEYADRTSARPGHSEHQLGTAVDIGARGLVLEAFIGTPEADWIQANSWKYGFIVSYPEGLEHITGYAYEPWHIRYVGREVAAEVHRSGLTLHEFLLQR